MHALCNYWMPPPVKLYIYQCLLYVKCSPLSDCGSSKRRDEAVKKIMSMVNKMCSARKKGDVVTEILLQKSVQKLFDPLQKELEATSHMILQLLPIYMDECTGEVGAITDIYRHRFLTFCLRPYLHGINGSKNTLDGSETVSTDVSLLTKAFEVLVLLKERRSGSDLVYNVLKNDMPNVDKMRQQNSTYLR